MNTTTSTTLTLTPHIDDLDRLFVANDISHSNEHCTGNTPEGVLHQGNWFPKADADGFLCSRCIDVSTRSLAGRLADAQRRADSVAAGGVSVDPPVHGDGSGRRHGAPAADLATAKQVAFLTTLMGEKPLAAAALSIDLDSITKRAASRAIDKLMAAPREYAAPAAAVDGAPEPARRNGYAGKCAECGGHVPAEAGSLAKENGRWVTRHFPTCPEVDEAEAAAPAKGQGLRATMFALKDRVVEVTGRQTQDRSIRVCVPAEVLGVEDQPDAAYKISWSYDWKGACRQTGGPGQIRSIDLGDASAIKLAEFLIAATAEELKGYQEAYGQHFHECGRCGSPLTDKDSKARGLGPDCAKLG